MADGRTRKLIKKASKYKYVSKYECERGVVRWEANLPNYKRTFDTEKECALAVDKKLIERGKEPVNILKRA